MAKYQGDPKKEMKPPVQYNPQTTPGAQKDITKPPSTFKIQPKPESNKK